MSGLRIAIFAICALGLGSFAPASCSLQQAGEASTERIESLFRQREATLALERDEVYTVPRRIAGLALSILPDPEQEVEQERARQGKEVTSGIPRDDARRRIEAWLDHVGSGRNHVPGWERFRALVGEGEDSRQFFAEALRAEPELFVLLGTEPDRLSEALRQQVAALVAFSTSRDGTTYDGGKIVGSNIGFGRLAAVLLLASDPLATTDQETDRGLSDLARHDIQLDFRGTYKAAATHQEMRYTPRHRVIMRLLGAWIARAGDPRSIRLKFELIDRSFPREEFDDSVLPLAVQYLRARGRRAEEPLATPVSDADLLRFAIDTLRTRGDRENTLLLAPYLEEPATLVAVRYQDGMRAYAVEVRDAALGAVVRLSGRALEDYGFAWEGQGTQFEVAYFPGVAARNRAFARCQEEFRELGLARPPKYEPEPIPPPEPIVYKKGDTSTALRSDPTGRVRIEIEGATARLLDAQTGAPIGGALRHLHSWAPEGRMQVTCWAFSPDGTRLATGAGYVVPQRSGDINVGRICVWQSATGALVEIAPGPTGRINGLAFGADGRTLFFQCDAYRIDGP